MMNMQIEKPSLVQFRTKIQDFVSYVEEIKSDIKDEESTKHSIILPLLSIMGYSVYDPREVKPEFTADLSEEYRRKEKVDYCVFKSKVPIFLLEAKVVGESLNNHNGQMSRYFNSIPDVRIAILTNGIRWKFFSDLDRPNVMDLRPFYEFSLDEFSEEDVQFLFKLTKENFQIQHILECAKQLKYTYKFKSGVDFSLPRLPGRPRILNVVRMTVTIDQQNFTAFHEYVNKHNLNKSEVIRGLIEQYLVENRAV